jgi:teichuronic acid biosynthesis glycosyltransferase TuaH
VIFPNMKSYHHIKSRDLILFSIQPWNSEIGFNLKDLAYELSRYNRVLFINRANDRKTVLKTKFSVKQSGWDGLETMEKIKDNFWILHPKSLMESVNWAPTYKLFDFFNRINNRRLAAEIKSAIAGLGFTNILFVNDNDFFRGLYLKALLPVNEYIYYLRDFLTAQPYFNKYGPRCEKEMISKADLVIVNSGWLASYASKWNPNCADIGQGCDPEAFSPNAISEPADLKEIPKPIIGYFGTITGMRLDEVLLLYAAECIPEAHFVFVGPSDEQFEKSSLRLKKNVHFLGMKRPDQSPAYIRHFNVCINPQLVNPQTVGNYPRKIDEYLAAGKPVVATATPAMEMFRDYTMLADTKEEYVMNIRRALSDPNWMSDESINRRRDFAQTHNWENVAGSLGNAYYSSIKNGRESD